MKRTTIYFAEYNTGHWEFQAFGAGETEAREALMKGWRKHKKATGATMEDSIIADEMHVVAVSLGQCLRDGDLIPDSLHLGREPMVEEQERSTSSPDRRWRRRC